MLKQYTPYGNGNMLNHPTFRYKRLVAVIGQRGRLQGIYIFNSLLGVSFWGGVWGGVVRHNLYLCMVRGAYDGYNEGTNEK